MMDPCAEKPSATASLHDHRGLTPKEEVFTALRKEPPKEYIKLRVRFPMGHSIQVFTHKGETIGELKGRIEQAEGTASTVQRLLFHGVILSEDRSLGSYGVGDAAVITAVPNLRLTERRKLHKPFSPGRGMLMTPGSTMQWTPHTSSKLDAPEHHAYFNSATMPPAWKLQLSPEAERTREAHHLLANLTLPPKSPKLRPKTSP